MGNVVEAQIFKRSSQGERETVRMRLYALDGTPCEMDILYGESTGEGATASPGMTWYGDFSDGPIPYNSVVRFENHLYIALADFSPDLPTFGNKAIRNLRADPEDWSSGVLGSEASPPSDVDSAFAHADVWGFNVTTEGYFDVTVTGGPDVSIWSLGGPNMISSTPASNQWLQVPVGLYVAVVGINTEDSVPYEIRAHPHPTWDPKAVVSSDIGPTPANSPQWQLMI